MPDVDTHVRRGHPVIFGLLAFFSFIEGCITAWLVSTYNRHGYPSGSFKDRTRFGVFTSWWTFAFSLAYMAFFLTGSMGVISSIASHAVWLLITWIFWTATAASITHMLGGGLNCGTTLYAHCAQLNAAEAFAWINWIIITVALVIVILLGSRSIRSGNKMSDPIGA